MSRINTPIIRRFTFAALMLLLIVVPNFGCATQRAFASPEVAMQSLVDAMRTHDHQQLLAIFGPDSDDLLFSGDPADDQLTLDRFVIAYDELHKLVFNDDGSVT